MVCNQRDRVSWFDRVYSLVYRIGVAVMGAFVNAVLGRRQKMSNKDNAFYEIAPTVEDAPSEAVFEFGRWLQGLLADKTGSGVDTGAGFNQFDLWAKRNGVEFFITVKLARKSMN